ncbi:uncharacterized protein METZ01_LOCUS283741, partial [marine metagenome]
VLTQAWRFDVVSGNGIVRFVMS